MIQVYTSTLVERYRGYHNQSLVAPIEGGGPAKTRVAPLEQQMQQRLSQLRQEFDERERGRNMHRIFGQNPNEISRRGPVTQE
jgi:hypothetical protein